MMLRTALIHRHQVVPADEVYPQLEERMLPQLRFSPSLYIVPAQTGRGGCATRRSSGGRASARGGSVVVDVVVVAVAD